MGSFHERVAAIQDSSVGQRSGRAHIHFDREFGLDAQPMGLLCGSIAMEYACSFHGVASHAIDGTRLLYSIVHEHRPTKSRLPLGNLIATHAVHSSIYGIEGRLHLLFEVRHFIELFGSIPVQLSPTVSKPYRSLLRRDVSLGLGH